MRTPYRTKIKFYYPGRPRTGISELAVLERVGPKRSDWEMTLYDNRYLGYMEAQLIGLGIYPETFDAGLSLISENEPEQ